MSNFVNLLDIVYPVGSIYQSMSTTSPADFIGGTWTKINTFLYGADTAKKTGGEAEHTLTIDEMPSHTHGIVVAVHNGGDAGYYRKLFATNSPAWNNGNPDWNNAARNTGGGKHTTTCRPIRPASSGTEQLKSKRGGVCLTTLTSWILSTQLGQSLFQTIQSRQQIQLVEHGQDSTVTHSFVMERPVQQAVRMKENFLSQIYHLIFGLQAALVRNLACLKLWVFCLIRATCMVLKHRVLLITQIANILTSRLTTVQSTGLLTSISAQPSYMLGGVA